jgi:hypothetical protein
VSKENFIEVMYECREHDDCQGNRICNKTEGICVVGGCTQEGITCEEGKECVEATGQCVAEGTTPYRLNNTDVGVSVDEPCWNICAEDNALAKDWCGGKLHRCYSENKDGELVIEDSSDDPESKCTDDAEISECCCRKVGRCTLTDIDCPDDGGAYFIEESASDESDDCYCNIWTGKCLPTYSKPKVFEVGGGRRCEEVCSGLSDTVQVYWNSTHNIRVENEYGCTNDCKYMTDPMQCGVADDEKEPITGTCTQECKRSKMKCCCVPGSPPRDSESREFVENHQDPLDCS